MNKILYSIAVVALFASCAKSYKIEGASSVSSLDGSKLFLAAVKDGEAKHIDSCEVVHGEFQFNGVLDTVKMAMLVMDGLQMPLVLEEGPIKISIDNASQRVSGTPLNETLYGFIDKQKQLQSQVNELSHKHSQMLLDGIDEQTIMQQLNIEADKISKEEDKLITDFITENFDNALGPGVFMMVTSGFRYPVLTPQLEFILSKATDAFKNDPYVSEYCKAAREIEAQQQGLLDVPQAPTAPAKTTPADTAAVAAPAQTPSPMIGVPQGQADNSEKNK